MTNQYINTYIAAGYTLSASYNYLLIQGKGRIGGSGLTVSGPTTVANRGSIAPVYSYTGVRLLEGGRLNNGPGGFISGSNGVYSSFGYAATVNNQGTINALNDPVLLYGGGSVTNGSLENETALMQGGNRLRIVGSPAVVANYGTIACGIYLQNGGLVTNGGALDAIAVMGGHQGVRLAAVGTVHNYGSVTATNYSGIGMAGGLVTNGDRTDTRATIFGATGVSLSASGTVNNWGAIEGLGSSGYAGLMMVGGAAYNGPAALIAGYQGVDVKTAAATITNTGTLRGLGVGSHSAGIALEAGGALINGSRANRFALVEGYDGAQLLGAGASTNFGTIVGLGGAGHEGLQLAGGARLTNGAADRTAALIEGDTGVSASGAARIVNFGTIEGDGGTAVALGSADSTLVVEAGSTFIGAINGGGGILELETGVGTLTGLLAGGGVTVSGSMATTSFSNFGTVQIDAAASFILADGGKVAAGQALIDNGALVFETLTSAGTLTIGGAFNGRELMLAAGKTTLNAGANLLVSDITESNAATKLTVGTNLTYGGTLTWSAGTLTVNTNDKLTLTGTKATFSGTLAGVGTVAFNNQAATLQGVTLSIAHIAIGGTAAKLSGTVANNSSIAVSSPGVAIANAGVSLTGTGSITLSSTAKITGNSATATLTNVSNKIYGAGQLGGGKMTLVNAAGGLIDGNQATGLTIDTGAATIANAGLIESAGSGLLTIKSAVNNTGTLYASGGTLIANGAVTGAGKVTIANGLADFVSTLANNVTFTATSTGTLELNKSQTYTGSISGFSKTGANFLDLADIAFTAGTTKATYSGTTTSGVLTVTDGTHTSKINLTGNYTTSTFVLASDGHGGTLIHDPAKATASAITPPARRDLTPPAAFIGAMAGLGSGGAATSLAGAGPPLKPLTLASPHAAAA